MKLAVLKGNRFNPWHLEVLARMGNDVEVTAFRAESEIQRHFQERGADATPFKVESIQFESRRNNPVQRLLNKITGSSHQREPRILPFCDRLKGYDVILSWELFTDWSEQAATAREKYGVPLAVMVWDNIPFNHDTEEGRAEIKRFVKARADRFLVYSERSRRALMLEGVAEHAITRLNPGIDVESFSPGPGSREGLNVPDDAFLILFVGWLLPRKGLDWLLYALRDLLDARGTKGCAPHLLVVGAGPGRERIESLLDTLKLRDKVTLLGSAPYTGMPRIYRAADLFVLPSIAMPTWQEQFGMSLIEAMACGLPVISTYSGAIPEVVAGTGVLCQPNDFVALRENIERLMQDEGERKHLGSLARTRAVAEYDVNAQARDMRKVLGDVAR